MRVHPASILAATLWWCSTSHAADDALVDEVIVEAARYISKVSAASKTPLERRDIAGSLSVITEQRIADQNLTNLVDTLSQVTGITVLPFGPREGLVKSRGYNVAAMFDGVPSDGALGYQQHDPAIYERIEVLRGPTGLLQGSSEPGGTVNFVTKRGLDRFGASVSASLGRWNTTRTIADLGGPLNTRGSVRARAVGVYDDRDYFARLSHYERRLGYARLDWDVTSSTTLSASVLGQYDSSVASYEGLPAFRSGVQLDVPRSTNLLPPWDGDDQDTEDLSMTIEQRIGNRWKLMARWLQRDQINQYLDATPRNGVEDADYTLLIGRRDYTHVHERMGVDLFLSGQVTLLGRAHSVLIGYNHDWFDTHSSGVERWNAATGAIRVQWDQVEQLPPMGLPYEEGRAIEREQSGFYVQTRISLGEPLTVVAGARISDLDYRSRSIAPSTPTPWVQGDQESAHVTPAASILYDVNAWLTLYGSYADTFVPQTLWTRANGESLDPRTGRQYEIGAKAAWLEDALQASVSIFDLRDEDRALADPENPGFYLNAGEIESRGWEMEVVGAPAPGLDLQLGYSRLDSKFLVASANLVGVRFSTLEPKHTWKLWAVHRIDSTASSGFAFGGGFNYQSGIESAPRRQGGYAIANAMAEYRFNDHASATLNASNIFDKVYYARVGATNTYNTFGVPRNYSIRLNVSF